MTDKRNDELIDLIGRSDFDSDDGDRGALSRNQEWRSMLGETTEIDRSPRRSSQSQPYDVESEPSGLFADSVDEWVHTYLIPNYVPTGAALWCDNWQAHPQAAYVFEGLWRAYEEARAVDMINTGGQSNMTFYAGYFLPLVDRLTNPAGPFAHCETEFCGTEPLFGTSHPFGRRLV